jgi:hypothetical protein
MKYNLLIFFLFFVLMSCSTQPSTSPILILATNLGFGTYTAEILKAEGFNEFQMDSLSDKKISKTYLENFDLVILAETGISPQQKKMLTGYVQNGGNLIAFRPDKDLNELFGIDSDEGTVDEGYIKVNSSADPGKGLPKTTLQFHGSSGKYKINGAKIIAGLFNGNETETDLPAVVSSSFGKGQTVAFLYNLPESIVLTRQGNPEFAGIEKDGIPGLRGLDLFAENWVDTTKNTINQADQQMALLSKCIEKLSETKKPLPRFWYFPDTLKCVATLTNDGEYRSETDFETQFHDVDSMGAKMTLYILETEKVSKAWADEWIAKGHEIAGHPDDTWEANNPQWKSMDSMLGVKINETKTKYQIPVSTNVNHWFVWCGTDSAGNRDFAAQAMLEEKNGIELDINYAHYDINSNQGKNYLGTPGYSQGNFTGSGLVMKFANCKGETVNVYQHFNAVYDQQYNELHNPEGFFNCFKGLVDRSLNDEIYSFVSIKSHNDEYYFSKEPLMKMLAYANSKNVPVWTAANLLDFIKMKDEASFSELTWEENSLSFNLNSKLKHSNGLTFMLPASFAGNKLKIVTKNGAATPFSIRKVKGSDFAFITVAGGSNYTFKASYGN